MAVTYDSFIARYPEFIDLDSSVVEAVLAESRQDVNTTAWGDKQDRAVMLMTAHVLALGKRGADGAAGPITSEQIGSYSRTYGTTGEQGGSPLASTTYGAEFLRLQRSLGLSPRVL